MQHSRSIPWPLIPDRARLRQRLSTLRWRRLVLLLGCAAVLATVLTQFGRNFTFVAATSALTPGLASQMYAVEQAGTRPFRQTRPRLELPLPLINDRAVLALVVAGNTPDPAPVTLTLGRQPINNVAALPGFRRYEMLLPDPVVAQPAQLIIQTPPLIEPNSNVRELGLALDQIGVRFVRPIGARGLDMSLLIQLGLIALGLHGLLLAQPRAQRVVLIVAASAMLLSVLLAAYALISMALLLSASLLLVLLSLAAVIVLRISRHATLHAVPRLALPAAVRAGGELIGWSAATAVLTYPLIANLDRAFPDKLDSYLNSWILAWTHRQLWRTPLQLFETNVLQPYPLTLAHSEHLLGLYPLTGPLLALGFTPAVVHNLAIFLAFVLCGFGMSLLVREMTGSTTAGIVAGLIYAFYPYRVLQMAHLQQVSAQWMPFTFWALERFRRSDRWRYALAAGMFFLLQSLVSYYHAIFLGVLVLIYGLFFLITDRRMRLRSRLIKLVAAGAGVLAIHIPLALPYLYLQRELGFGRSVNDALTFSAALADYLMPFGFNETYYTTARLLNRLAPYPTDQWSYLLGDWQTVSGRLTQETLLFPGILPLAIAVLGLIVGRRRRIVQWAAIALAVCFVLSLGPVLRLDWRGDPLIGGMPFGLLPVARVVRAPARFVLAEIVVVAVLAGMGSAWLIGRVRTRHAPIAWLATLLLIVAVAGELARVPVTLYPIEADDPAVEQWLADQPRGLVLQLPVGESFAREAQYEFRSTAHFQPMLNGYSGYSDLPTFWGFFHDFREQPTAAHLRVLQGLGLRYLVVRHAEMPQADRIKIEQRLAQTPDVEKIPLSAGADAYVLPPDPWIDQIEAQLAGDQGLFVSNGGDLPTWSASMIALRLHAHVAAGDVRFGYRSLTPPPPDQLPAYGLFGIGENPAAIGYNVSNVVWHNDVVQLIRRDQP